MVRTPRIRAKHKALADRYLVHRNGARAAEEVGYAKESAKQEAHRVLSRPEVKEYVTANEKRLELESRLKAYRTRDELAIIAYSSVTDFIVTRSGRVTLAPGVPEETWRAVRAIEYKRVGGRLVPKIRLWPKEAALRMIGEHLGMFKQVIETRERTLEDALDELENDELEDAAGSGREAL